MSEKTTRTDHPSLMPIRPEVLHHLAERPLSSLSPGTLRKVLDCYTPGIFNRVMKGLKSLISFRPERSFELAARREQAVEKGQEGPMVMKGGRMVAAAPQAPSEAHEAHAHAAPELSLFEKIFLAHFEGKIPLGGKLEKGKFAYLGKSEKSWGEFFQRFLPFTLEKKGRVTDLEGLVYRGLLKQVGPKGEKGTLISDLKFQNGKTDKFARLEVQGLRILQELASRLPGDVLAQALVAEWIGGPEFAYHAIAHRVVDPALVKTISSPVAEAYQSPEAAREAALREGIREVRQGIALSARTEELIAERLDLKTIRGDFALDPRSRGAREAQEAPGLLSGLFFKKRKKGLFGGMFEEGAGTEGTFVPWYQLAFRPRRWKGKPRWWVPLLYFTAFSAAGLFAFYIFRFLLQR